MSRPDYQGTLGFELVTVTEPNGAEIHLILEDGADDREATLTERVLWSSLVEALAALHGLDEAFCRAGSPLTQAERTEDRKRLIAARAALNLSGWQS